MDPDGGFSALLAAAEDVKKGDTVRGGEDNKEILTEYTGTISSDAVEALIPTAAGDFSSPTRSPTTTSSARRCSRASSTARTPGDVTYTLTLDDYGTEKDITAP